MGSNKSNLKLELSIEFHLGSLCSGPELESLLKRRLGSVSLSFELKLSAKSHLGSLFLISKLELLQGLTWGRVWSSPELELLLQLNLRSLCPSPKLEFLWNFVAEFLIETRTVTVSGLNISQIQILNSFFHLLLTSVNSSRKLIRVIGSLGSHSGQFLNYKPVWDVPSRPDSPWAAVQTRGKTSSTNKICWKKIISESSILCY